MEERAKVLLSKYYKGKATAQEQELIEKWFLEYKVEQLSNLSDQDLEKIHDRSWERILIHTQIRPVKKLWPKLAVAASLILIFGASLLYYALKSKQKEFQNSSYVNDVGPGKSGATLTLGNGKRIRLSDAINGKLAEEAGVRITKSADGKVIYEIKGSESGLSKTNTLSTAKGETYQIQLPDGSAVFLNAASSLIYSASLMENGKRIVRLKGEGYFEVAKDKEHPFVVKTDRQEVEVLGTHFNVNAYEDEACTRTTLLQGMVKISAKHHPDAYQGNIILKPNQQSEVKDNSSIKVLQVDAEGAVAWKNGYFKFDSTPLNEVMHQVERWYNVNVVYESDAARSMVFEGTVSRDNNVSKLLKTLENTGAVKFRIEGSTVYVGR